MNDSLLGKSEEQCNILKATDIISNQTYKTKKTIPVLAAMSSENISIDKEEYEKTSLKSVSTIDAAFVTPSNINRKPSQAELLYLQSLSQSEKRGLTPRNSTLETKRNSKGLALSILLSQEGKDYNDDVSRSIAHSYLQMPKKNAESRLISYENLQGLCKNTLCKPCVIDNN